MLTRLCFLCVIVLRMSVCEDRSAALFKAYPCAETNLQLGGMGIGQVSRLASNQLKCAIFCNVHEACRYAVFRSSSRNCTLVSEDETCPSSAPPYASEEGCSVLYKLRQKTGEETQRLGTVGGAEPWSLSPGSATRMAWSDSSVTYFESVMAIHASDTDLITTSAPAFSFKFDPADFTRPISLELLTFDITRNSRWRNLVTIEGEMETFPNQSSCNVKFLMDSYPESTRLAYDKATNTGSLDNVISAVSQGFRPVVRYPAWLEMDPQAGDVVVHMAGMLAAQTSLNMKKPTHMLSIAESTKNGIRHEFRHPISQAPNAVYRKVNTQPRWEFDTSWEKLTPSDPSVTEEVSFDDLKKAVLSGREMRVLINGTVSSDIIFVTIESDDIVFQLADHLAPVADDVAEVTELRVRVTSLTFSRKLFTCEMTYHGVPIHGHNTEYINNTGDTVEWFVSTRQWTKVLEKGGGRIKFGSNDELYGGVVRGKKARVCAATYTSETICFTPTKLTVVSSTNVVGQSPHVLRQLTDAPTITDVRSDPCCLTMRTVSTKGWTKTCNFIRGQAKKFMAANFRSHSWFLET